MNLDGYMEIVLGSQPRDWNVVTCGGASAGPSYRDKFEIWTLGGDEGKWRLDVRSHGLTAALRSDLSVTMAWGMTANEDFKEDWANSFPDPHASSSYVDFFFNGALVDRELYVTVDGGRVSLPLPDERNGKLVAPRAYADLCRLLASLESAYGDDFDRYVKTAGIDLVDEPWPRR